MTGRARIDQNRCTKIRKLLKIELGKRKPYVDFLKVFDVGWHWPTCQGPLLIPIHIIGPARFDLMCNLPSVNSPHLLKQNWRNVANSRSSICGKSLMSCQRDTNLRKSTQFSNGSSIKIIGWDGRMSLIVGICGRKSYFIFRISTL